jgi:UDP-3-O-[3-hydroxymyristoyl] glucosamine N-acyltransferase
VTDHVEIGHDVTVGAQSGVTKSLPPGVTVLGSPAIPHMDLKRTISSMGRMPKLLKDVRALEERIRRLEERVEKGC